MTTRPKRFLACLLAVALVMAPTAGRPGDLNAEMQAMFNDLGALGNVTSPGAFRGQAMNLYTGGSLMMRAPGRNYPLVNAQLPSLRAGCGGIDLFGGAFSFINKQQFVALLQNIGSNAIGYAFKLALQSISPDIDKLLTELQDQINKINAMNINSCEAAQSLVNGIVGEYDNSMHERLREHLAVPGERHRPGRWPARLRNQRPGRGQDGRQLRRSECPERDLREGQRDLDGVEPGGWHHQPAGEGTHHERDRHGHPLPTGGRRQRRDAALRRTEHRGPARSSARARRVRHGGQCRHRGLRLRRADRVPQSRSDHRLRQTLHAARFRAAASHVRQHRDPHAPDARRYRLRQQHDGTGLQDAGGRQRRARAPIPPRR